MSDGTFSCPGCHDAYQPHWREGDLCRACSHSASDGTCPAGEHEPDGYCAGPAELPGEPCRWCSHPAGADCPRCWTPVDGLPLADIKALFASDDVLSIGGLGSANGP